MRAAIAHYLRHGYRRHLCPICHLLTGQSWPPDRTGTSQNRKD